MSAMFHVGQKVVCVGSKGTPRPAGHWDQWVRDWKVILPKRGGIYTIRDVRVGKERQHVRLVEILNPIIKFNDAPDQEVWFWADAFRPVRETSIECFRALLNTKPGDVPADLEEVSA